jgi:hypothetical protein
VAIPQRGGLPHSDIHGSTPARGSPWLFAACHVLHRLLVPRHPPNALLSLEIIVPGLTRGFSTMHRNHPQCSVTSNDDQDDHHHPSLKTENNSVHRNISRSAHNCRHLNDCPARWRPPRRRSNTSGQTCEQARPETHQNLIHPNKERRLQPETPTASQFHLEPSMPITFASPRYPPNQLDTPIPNIRIVVEVIGLEPTTPCLQSRCSPS